MPPDADEVDGVYRPGSKEILCDYFLRTAGIALNALFNRSVLTRDKTRSGLVIDVRSALDFVSRRVAGTTLNYVSALAGNGSVPQDLDLNDCFVADSKQFAISLDSVLAVGDAKLKNLVVGGHDELHRTLNLPERYTKRDKQVCAVICELTGYHMKLRCRYGFITTFQWTWATYLSPSGVLYVSPAFSSSASGKGSTLNMMFYLLSLASNQLGDGSISNVWNLPTILPPGPYEKPLIKLSLDEAKLTKMTSKSKPVLQSPATQSLPAASQHLLSVRDVKDNCMVEVELIQVMSVHDNRITWKAQVIGSSTIVAIKAYEQEEFRNIEVACYRALISLQGITIPRLLNARYHFEEDKLCKHAHVVSWVGAERGGNYMILPTKVLKQAWNVMLEMQRLGVVHGDLRPENMYYNFATDELFIYDFSDASTKNMLGTSEFERACKVERKMLEILIQDSRTSEEQKLQYF